MMDGVMAFDKTKHPLKERLGNDFVILESSIQRFTPRVVNIGQSEITRILWWTEKFVRSIIYCKQT